MGTVAEQLETCLRARDAGALHTLLTSLDARQCQAARAWVSENEELFAELSHAEYRNQGGRRRELIGSAPWMQTMCIIATSPPTEAARITPWTRFQFYMRPEAKEHASLLLAARPRAWADTFLTAAAATRLPRGGGRDQGEPLARFIARGLADHDLPCPAGATFLEYYLRDGGDAAVAADRLNHEQLLPDLLHLMIEQGYAGNLETLGTVVSGLVDSGIVRRDRLIESCLVGLTSDTRVTSQRVIAKVLSALDLRADEVPGGLAFLTETIATRVGMVGLVLLPRALAVVDDVAGLEELVRVVAGRSERRQKRLLLSSLLEPGLLDRVGHDGALTGLEVLGVGEVDAGMLRAIERVREDLGGTPGAEDARPVVGLWDRSFDPGPVVPWPWWIDEPARHWQPLITRPTTPRAGFDEPAISAFLHAVAVHGPRVLEESCRQLRVDGRLALTRVPDLVELAFVSGGLRTLWLAALAVADDVAGAGRMLPGLSDLLRLLTRYASEVPAGPTLPRHLARLAREDGATATQLETRALETALGGRTDTDVVAAASTRGLWELRSSTLTLARLLTRYPSTPRQPFGEAELLYLLDVGLDRSRQPDHAPENRDAQLISALAIEAQWFGSQALRGRVASASASGGPSGRGPTMDAIRTWASGRLVPRTYGHAVSADGSSHTGQDRVVFAWTCEQLVRLDSHPGLLSVLFPNGTFVQPLALARFVRTLSGAAAEVGPLDLLLALMRMRVLGSANDEIALALLDDVQLWTDPRVTAGPSFDVVPLIRAGVTDCGRGLAVALDEGLFGCVTQDDLRGPASHPDVRRRIYPREPIDHDWARWDRSDHHDRVELEDGRLPTSAWQRLLDGLLAQGDHASSTSRRQVGALAAHDGVLDVRVTLPPALAMLDAGALPLSRLADSLRWLAERGGLRVAWPLGLGVAAAAVSRRPKPNGLPFLFSTLASYAHEVPIANRVVPEQIVAFATSTGRSRGQVAARDLVSALGSAEDPVR